MKLQKVFSPVDPSFIVGKSLLSQMKSYNCFILEPLSEIGQQVLKNEDSWLLTKLDCLENAYEDADALIVRTTPSLSRERLQAFKKLKLIVRAGNGLDHIDLNAAEELGIEVLSTPEASADSAAEMTLLLILSAARQIQNHQTDLTQGAWRKNSPLGIELHGQTAGIIGLGRIGSRVARVLQAMGMRCIACDPYLESERAQALKVELHPFTEVLAQSDIVSIHTPLTSETRSLFDATAISKMKTGSILVNCARGGIVDEQAACEALTSGKLFSYAADVFESEPVDVSQPLLKQKNFVGSAHLGARTFRAQSRVDEAAARCVVHFFKKERSVEKS